MDRRPFSSRLFLSVVALFLLFTGCFVFYQYSREKSYRTDLLQTRLQDFNQEVYNLLDLMNVGDSIDGRTDEALEFFLNQQHRQGLRLTLIRTDGRVIFDSADTTAQRYDSYDNHLDRDEVQSALKKSEGIGVIRQSETLGQDYFYSATFRKESTFIVRSALPYNTALQHSLSSDQHYLWFAGLITLILLLIFFYVTRKMGSSINEKENLLTHLSISKEGLGVFDRQRRLVLANSLFNQYLNVISDLHMASSEEIFQVSEFAPVLDFLNKRLPEKHNHTDKEPIISFCIEKSGRIFSVDCVLFIDRGFEISINDITQEEEQTRLKHQLTQNIAHELKTPVSSILGYLETIIEAQKNGSLPPDKMQHFLERCYSQCERLNNLVQDISILSKMGDTSRLIEKNPVDISLMVRNMTQEVALRLESQQMTIDNQLPASLIVNGNSSMLYSIFRNLTDNAIAYAGVGTTITIRLFRIENEIYYFSFSDNGVGVEEQHLNRIFERFYRVDKGRSRKMGGTGLGLAIVKNAVTLHGGTIAAKSRPEGGLEFIFTLEA